MHDFPMNIRKEAAKTRLRPDEKSAIRKTVLAAIAASPASSRKAASSALFLAGVWRSFLMIPRALPASLALLLLLSVGTAFAAEGALPGDLLYPVKVSVNEKVLTAVALSRGAKASAETRILERRLEEAAELSARGELSLETSAELASRFDEGAERLANALEELEADGKLSSAEAALERLSVDVGARGEVLKRVVNEAANGEEGAAPGGERKELITARAARVSNAAKRLRESLEETLVTEARATATLETTAEEKIDSAEGKIEQARNLREKNSERLKTDIAREVEETLQRAEERARDAREELEAGNADSAFSKALESRAEVEEARQRIEVEVRTKTLFDKYDNRRGSADGEDIVGVPRLEVDTRLEKAQSPETRESHIDSSRAPGGDNFHDAKNGDDEEEVDTQKDDGREKR